MVTQSESDSGSGEGKVKEPSASPSPEDRAGPVPQAEDLEPRPFDPDDTQRAARISALDGKASEFLSSVGIRPSGYRRLTPAQLRSLHSDATERAGWPTAQQDVFRGLLRLGHSVPSRSRRVL